MTLAGTINPPDPQNPKFQNLKFHDLRDRSDEVSTFATHVSHELKSPLTAIQGAAELLRDSDMSEAQREKFLNNIISDTSRLNLLVRQLLDLALYRASSRKLA